LEQIIAEKNIAWGRFSWGAAIGLIFILAVSVNALLKYDPYPSDCCKIMSADDLDAIQWIDNDLPEDARILVASTDLNVLPTTDYQGSAGGDAGTWINPLTGRTTIYMPFTTDFNQQQTLDRICESQVGYIYVGKTGTVFNESGMDAQPDKYKLVLFVPKTKVYQVVGCQS
jgi:hypothetical protein